MSDIAKPPMLFDLKQTCVMSPSQWKARTGDDRPVYIRYRHGYLSVRIGPQGGDTWSAIDAEEWFGEQLAGDDDPGIELEEVQRVTGIEVASFASEP
jgi:hypothetical protein